MRTCWGLETVLCFFLLGAFVSCDSKKRKISMAQGKEIYIAHCISCHQPSGEGIIGRYPSLVKTEALSFDQTLRAIRLIKNGSGFEGGMNPIHLSEHEINDVINYIQNSWGNEAPFLDSIPKKTRYANR